MARVEKLLDQGFDVKAPEVEKVVSCGDNLYDAVRYGHRNVVKLLLEHGADVNVQVEHYGNALQAAAYRENQEIISLLLERGADINVQGGYYGNALQAAAAGGHPRTVKLLLDYGADVTMQPKMAHRLSLLHVGVRSGSLAVLETLCGAGADIHLKTQDESGLTPLHTAVNEKHVAMVEYLLERGASPNVEDLGGNSPLQLAIHNRNRKIVLLLYPKTNLSSITASDLRRCSRTNGYCHLEIISGDSAQVAFRDESLFEELDEMSFPLSFSTTQLPAYGNDFMSKHFDAKQML